MAFIRKIFCVLCFGLCTQAYADGTLDCDHAVTQTDMNSCAFKDSKKADTELEEIYSVIMTKLDDDGKIRLKSAKDAWIQYRITQCEFETANSIGGTIHPMNLSGCYEAMTLEYIKKLKYQLSCEEYYPDCLALKLQ